MPGRTSSARKCSEVDHCNRLSPTMDFNRRDTIYGQTGCLATHNNYITLCTMCEVILTSCNFQSLYKLALFWSGQSSWWFANIRAVVLSESHYNRQPSAWWHCRNNDDVIKCSWPTSTYSSSPLPGASALHARVSRSSMLPAGWSV